ncbi:MAG: hypothetical protein RLZZ603_1042 [Actinomycetota bacterium]
MALTNILLAVLGLIAVLGPFGTDVYLPALPQMAHDLHTTASGAQLVITFFSIGMAIGQLIMGSTSDRFGRRPLLIAGPGLMAAACLASAFAPNITVLLFTNIAIGIAACTGMVVGRALISDIAKDTDAARGYALMGMVVGLGPVIGPIGGALVMGISNWRGIFVAMAIFAAVLTVLAIFAIPETLPVEKRHSGGLAKLIRASGSIIRDRNYLRHSLVLWSSLMLLFGYISASPFIVETLLGISPFWYTIDFAFNGTLMIVTGGIVARLVHRVGPRQMVKLALAMQALAATIFGAMTLLNSFGHVPVSPIAVFATFALIPSSLSFLYGPVTALALRDIQSLTGTALAIQGAVQFLVVGTVATLVGAAGDQAIWPLAIVLACGSGIGVLAFIKKP